jgi:hypothetical protein
LLGDELESVEEVADLEGLLKYLPGDEEPQQHQPRELVFWS